MKRYLTILLFAKLGLLLSMCGTTKKTAELITYKDSSVVVDNAMNIHLTNGPAFNHPSYVIWEEDMQGNFIRTLFITKSYASGVFGYQMVADTVWLKVEGASYQPGALPYWTHKKGLINGKQLIPSPENPYVDAYSGATPKGDFIFETSSKQKKPFRILIEYNQAWDWNDYWTNNKYPTNQAYKHSAQPSLIWAVTVDGAHSTYYLNPIGHGDPTGKTGHLFTDLTGSTSSKEIFKQISLSLK